MEPDSTTNDIKNCSFPFPVQPGNLQFYKYMTENNNDGPHQMQEALVKKMQEVGLLVASIKCRTNSTDCIMVCKSARVVDRFQWVCEGCGSKVPIRFGSFFMRINCLLLQALQVILSWCEDADWEVVAQHFDVKSKVVIQIYDKLDMLAAEQQQQTRLGGPDSVVLAETYPDCLNKLSPDTTDEPYAHTIFMLADTKHIPTRYWLHVMKNDSRKSENCVFDNKQAVAEMESVIERVTSPGSALVAGATAAAAAGAEPLDALLDHCDADMRHFLCSGIWSQALRLCAATRSGGSTSTAAAAAAVQMYLHAALYKVRFRDGFYHHTLDLLAQQCVT